MKTDINKILKIIVKRSNQRNNTNIPAFFDINDFKNIKEEDLLALSKEFNDLINYPRDAKFLDLVKKLRKESGKNIRNFQDFSLLIEDLKKGNNKDENSNEEAIDDEVDPYDETDYDDYNVFDEYDNQEIERVKKERQAVKNKPKKKRKLKDTLKISKYSSKIILTLGLSTVLTAIVLPGVKGLLPTFQVPGIVSGAIWTYALISSGMNGYKIYKILNKDKENQDEKVESDEEELDQSLTRDQELERLNERILELENLVRDGSEATAEELNAEVEEADLRSEDQTEIENINSQKEKLKIDKERLNKLKDNVIGINAAIRVCDFALKYIENSTGLSYRELYNRKVNNEYVDIFNRKRKLLKLLKAYNEVLNTKDAVKFNNVYENIEKTFDFFEDVDKTLNSIK